mmetsp:Transcript_90247/g.159812  ORF Transcript_90247/g.159812 Transcript_90247/m.159812 type:complete len:99 (-) Transcript_90247:7-303(-)
MSLWRASGPLPLETTRALCGPTVLKRLDESRSRLRPGPEEMLLRALSERIPSRDSIRNSSAARASKLWPRALTGGRVDEATEVMLQCFQRIHCTCMHS